VHLCAIENVGRWIIGRFTMTCDYSNCISSFYCATQR